MRVTKLLKILVLDWRLMLHNAADCGKYSRKTKDEIQKRSTHMIIQASRFVKVAIYASAVVLLVACGGGGGQSGSSVAGVAATGMAISNGQVSLKCVEGSAGPVLTQTDGSFKLDVSQVKMPCVARVEYADSTGIKKRLHSAVQASGTVNITPLTDMVVANLSVKGIAADTYDHSEAGELQGFTPDRIKTAAQTVKSKLSSKGLDVTHLPDDFMGTPLTAATPSRRGDSHDDLLDSLQTKLHDQGTTLEDLETEMSAGNEKRGLSTSTGSLGDAQSGKLAYETNCQVCHGARIPDAVNSAKIIEAIRENEGGMRSLAGIINVSVADDIATYMANGVTGAGVTPLKTQSIVFQSPGPQTIGASTPTVVATASSGLAVTISSLTPAVCTVTGNSLLLHSAGNCTLLASQPGNTTYNAATPVTNSFAVVPSSGVMPSAQTITFASPGPQTVGVTTTLSASSSSGLAVTLASSTPQVCTVNGNILTSLASGTCTLTANQQGNASFAAAPMVTLTLSVISSTPVTSASNGKALYASNSCGGCHGTPPAYAMVLNGANNPMVIQSAISNIGGMNRYTNLTSQNLADIAAYLATPGL